MREGMWVKTKVVGGEAREMKHVRKTKVEAGIFRVVTGVAQYVRRSCLGVDQKCLGLFCIFVCRVEFPSNIF